jgi:hypothetical protein
MDGTRSEEELLRLVHACDTCGSRGPYIVSALLTGVLSLTDHGADCVSLVSAVVPDDELVHCQACGTAVPYLEWKGSQ